MSKDRIQNLSFIVIALLGMAVLAISMRHGPGIGGDATIYLTSARNLLEGNGLGLTGPRGEFRLIPYFPPGYSLLLSLAGLFGADLVAAACWINLVAFGGIIWLSGFSLFRITKELLFSLLLSCIIMASPVLAPVYSWAMAEPPAILLGFGGLVLLLVSFSREHHSKIFFASALACGLAFLTRYNAVAFLATGSLFIVVFYAGGWARKMLKAGTYFLSGFIPMLVWLAVDLSQTANVASRSIESGSGMAERFFDLWGKLADVFLFWMIPDSWITTPPYPGVINTVIITAALVGIAVWTWYAARITRPADRYILPALVWMPVMFCVVFLAITALVYITTYPPITIGSRMLSPLHTAVLWLALALAHITYHHWRQHEWLRPALLAAAVLFLGWYGARTIRIVQQNYELGSGYLSPAWQGSETIKAARDLPEDTLIITNEETAILFLTGRTSYPIAEIYRDKPLEDFTVYGEGELADDQAQYAFRRQGAAFVLFDSIHTQMAGLYGERTVERVDVLTESLQTAFEGEDGAIYYYPGSP